MFMIVTNLVVKNTLKLVHCIVEGFGVFLRGKGVVLKFVVSD